jgi:hypothetical protein
MQASTQTFQALEATVGQLPIADVEARRMQVDRLRGCLHQPGQAVLTDEGVDQLREQRLVERYIG